jgi:hypothetical protein
MTPIRSLVTVSVPALFLGALLGAPAPAQAGSHKNVMICAKIHWTYQPRGGGRNISGTTPERCGHKYRASHDAKGVQEAKASRERACHKAWLGLPRLQQGDVWLMRSCVPYQVKVGG